MGANDMLIIAAIIIIALCLVMFLKGGKEEICDTCKPVIEEPCAVLKKLYVLYEGRFLASGEVVKVPYNKSVKFAVKGFDITGTKEACINGSEVMWLKSCGCTHWEYSDGLTNSVLVNSQVKNIARNVWVKYTNGVTFVWKVMVV